MSKPVIVFKISGDNDNRIKGKEPLKEFIQRMKKEYGGNHTLVFRVDVFDIKEL